MAKTLIIYYSRRGENYVNGDIINLPVGNTERAAQYIADAVGADLFRVETVTPYPKDYYECTEKAKEEIRHRARPELSRYLEDISSYDSIVVAGPCWWGTYPMAIFSLLERLDFQGKKVFPLVTHEGSGLGSARGALKKYCVGAVIGEGLAIHGAEVESAKERVRQWARKNLG